MAKVLMLWPDITEDIPSMIKKEYSEYVDIRNLYKKIGTLGRVIRKWKSKMNFSTEIFFDDWIEDLEKYEKIIIHANIINRTVPIVLRKKGYSGRIIYWYWNPVCNCISPSKINRNYCELWSFSKEDCEVYNMHYNSTYYFLQPKPVVLQPTIDLFFIGADKGRYEKLMKIKRAAETVGLTVDFRIIKDQTSILDGEYADRMNYSEVVEMIHKSKTIVELLQEGQTGFSLRVMEGLSFNKKVISDNSLLRKEPYFCDKRFYVICQEEWEKTDLELGENIKAFVNGVESPIDNRWIEYYNYKNWLLRFDEEE